MKYKPGTFILVPNILLLAGKPSEMQVIYMWLCTYADKEGKCFPSRATLARQSGCGIRTVDKYLEKLVEEDFILKEIRRSSTGKQNLSNTYTLLLKDSEIDTLCQVSDPANVTQVQELHPNVIQKNTRDSVEKSTGTISINNYNNGTIGKEILALVEKEKEDMKFTTKSEKEKLISGVYGAWIKMASATLDMDEKDVDKSTLMRSVSYAIKREEDWKLEDFKSLFKYFFADEKMAFEKKLSYALCLSSTYISQYKLAKKGAKKQGEFKL